MATAMERFAVVWHRSVARMNPIALTSLPAVMMASANHTAGMCCMSIFGRVGL